MKIKDHFLSQEEFELQETHTKGILKTFPIPNKIEKYYESKNYISHYQDNSSLKEKVYKFLQTINLKYKKKILEEIGLNKTSKVLDYGCGAGEFIKYISEDYKTFGYEPNEKARNFAQQKNSKTIFLSSPTLSEIENESLDLITLWHVFEHIENQDEILSIFHQKLNSNGKLIIAVPNHTSYDAKHYKEFWAAYDVPRHIWHFSKNGMLQLMNNEKWKIEKISPLLLDAFYISMLSEKYKKNPLFWLFGAIHGAISNFKASKTGEFSSLIYIIKKV